MKKFMIVIVLMLVLSCQRCNSQRQSFQTWPVKYPSKEIKTNIQFSGPFVDDARNAQSKKKTAKSFSKSKAYGMWLRYGKRSDLV